MKLLFRHQLLIDAMLKWKTLDYEEIDLLLSKKSLEALQKYREDNEKKRKQATGKIFHLGSIWVRLGLGGQYRGVRLTDGRRLYTAPCEIRTK